MARLIPGCQQSPQPGSIGSKGVSGWGAGVRAEAPAGSPVATAGVAHLGYGIFMEVLRIFWSLEPP